MVQLWPEGLTVRSATDADRQRILELEEQGMREYAETLWGHWKPSSTPAELDLTGHMVAERQGRVIASLQTLQHRDCVQLARLYVAPEARRRTIGKALLGLVIQRFPSQPITLRVLTSNPNARRFYEREGFLLVGSTPERWFFERAASVPDHTPLASS